MKDRIKQIQDYAKLSQQDFANFIGISPATLCGVYTGRTQASNKLVTAIHNAFPEINLYWLMFGTGDMFVSKSPEMKASGEEGSKPTPAIQPSAISNEGVVASDLMRSETSSLSVPGKDANSTTARYSDDILQQPHSARQEHVHSSRVAGIAMNNMKNIYKQTRKIKEIRVFFDDGTYEAFVPSSK